MTTPRLPHHRAAPTLTGGADTETVPCNNPRGVETFNALIDREKNANPHPEYVAAARNMCGTCVIRNPAVADECLRGALARGEKWVGIVLGRKVPPPPPDLDNMRSTAAAQAHEDRREARLADLRAFIAAGTPLDEVCARLGITRDGLWKWLDKWGHGDIWRALSPPRRAAVIAKPDRRRKRVAA